MRYLTRSLILGLLFVGCEDFGDPILVQNPSASVGDFTFTLSVPSKTLSVKDTLRASVEVYNKSSAPETLDVDYSYLDWWLKNAQGDTVMDYYGSVPLGQALLVGSHQSITIEEYSIKQAIEPWVAPGNYLLEVQLFYPPTRAYFSLSLSLNLF